MVAMLVREDLQQRLAANCTESHLFNPWDQQILLPFDVVSHELEPDMEVFWGLCEESHRYFISEAVPTEIRCFILQMEQWRIENKANHARGVYIALQHPTRPPGGCFVETALKFYTALQTSYQLASPSAEQQYIDTAVELLRNA